MVNQHSDPTEHAEPPDYPLGRATLLEGRPTEVRQRRRVGILVATVVLLIAIGAAWILVIRGPGTQPGVESAQSQTPAAEPSRPLGGSPDPISVPPLDQSDAVVRDLVRQLTTHPTVIAWLATDGLIRNFTLSVANTADGITPARHLRGLRPSEPFAVTRDGERLLMDPASYERFDRFAAALASISPDRAARLYATLKPRLEDAYRELGHPDTSVDEAIEKSIVALLRTPVVDRGVEVRPGLKGIGYVYADPNLEALTGAQKQLLRMGPDNVRSVQRSLRAIALALGIPSSRLPEPTPLSSHRGRPQGELVAGRPALQNPIDASS
jgi:hypothetical protein